MATERGLLYIGEAKKFAQQTFTHVDPSPYLPEFEDYGLWRSPVSQSLILKDLQEFVLRSRKRPNDPYLEQAIYHTFTHFHLPDKVKMIHLNDVFARSDLDIWSKSPGLPWREYGYKTKGDIRSDPDAIRRVRKFAHLVKNGYDMHFPDCLAYMRSHTCPRGESKVRAVWGYPATVTFIEAMYALPLIEAYKERFDELRPIAYGFETAVGGMKKICKRFLRPDCFYVGLDFKKFDKTVPPWLIRIAFDILMYNIDFKHYKDYGVADARKNILLFYALEHYFINTTIRTANGSRYRKFSGIASGSYFTQLIGSVVNSILINWMSFSQFGCFPIDAIFLGDDSLLSSHRPWNFKWCQNFVRKIGMEINIDKSAQSESLNSMKFLGYTIGGGQPSKPFSEWMTALIYPERPDSQMSDLQNRALGLYYANMGVDSYFSHICKVIVTLKPFDIAFTKNFSRMLKHIGIDVSKIDPINLPDPLYFTKFM